MSSTERAATTNALPSVLPVFPLPGALLLPGAQLPLNIFEPRYLNMIDDALRTERLIGMVQPSAGVEEHLVPDGIGLFDIGCAGRITQFAETDDGRYIIALSGQRRFRILDEIEQINGYRRVVPDFKSFAGDDDDKLNGKIAERETLLAEMTRYFEARDISAKSEAVAAAPDPVLVNTLAMSCPFEPREKQALLECSGTAERAALLIELFRFSSHTPNQPTHEIKQ